MMAAIAEEIRYPPMSEAVITPSVQRLMYSPMQRRVQRRANSR
jgi:hypothetical protein